MSRDAKGRPLIPLLNERKEPTGGSHIVLTIDEDLQHVAQEALRRACDQYAPRRGMVVIQDPLTGEVLAVSNWPDFDPNDFSGSSTRVRRNAAFVDVFEPGSTFKIVTAVAALQEQLVDPYEEIYCYNGRLPYYGHVIRDVHPLEKASFVDVIVHSSNNGTIQVASRLGPERFYEYMRRMGFGQLTGTNFPGESRGILRPVGKWSKRSMGALPIGQEIAVTALQLAQAFSTVANGGVKMRPRIVRAILAEDGSVIEEFEPETDRVVCSPQVAQLVTEMLCGVVEDGTGTRGAVEGYRVAGKTGTAQISVPGGYAKDRHMTVFAGFVPADMPAYTIVVVLDSPHTKPRLDTGGRVSAPVFKEIAQHSLRIAGIAPRIAEPEPEEESAGINEIAAGEDIVQPLRRPKAAPRRSEPAKRTRVRMPLSLVHDVESADSMLQEALFEEPVIAR
jgi:cell division protein FtsI/penicillin-binding protein 2